MVSERIATLQELKTVYDLEDLFMMNEAVMVKYNNEAEAIARSKDR